MNAGALKEGVRSLFSRFESEPEHPQHVARLALSLFDELGDWHRFGDDERLVLEAASLLHDIGWSETRPSGRAHHKAGARLIRAHDWPGLDPAVVNLVAQIARYHRKALPGVRHPEFIALGPQERVKVRVLAGILRMADGLDRRHLQRVSAVRVLPLPPTLLIEVYATGDAGPEMEAARRKGDLLRAEFGSDFAWRQHLPEPDDAEPAKPPASG